MRASLEQWTALNRADEYEAEEYSSAGEHENGLSPRGLAAARRANRQLSRQIGWGLSRTDSIIPQLRTDLGLGLAPTEEQLAEAIAARQVTLGLRPSGQLDNRTWDRLRPRLLPATRFRRFRIEVSHAGRSLGILEKVAPFRRFTAGGRRGVEIQL
jgi:hypothetical protein